MNSDASIAAHLSIGTKVNGQQNFTVFIENFLPVSVDDLCLHACYEHCGNVLSTWVKLPYSSAKILIDINYCTTVITVRT